jgi:hypothetical protein
MVHFDLADFASKKSKTTFMVADSKIATPKHANSDTRVCAFLAQVPPLEACGASQNMPIATRACVRFWHKSLLRRLAAPASPGTPGL